MTERRIVWMGDSKKSLLGMPSEVKSAVGYALSEAQSGRKAGYAKPLSGVGSGVLEIVVDHNTDTYRAVYAVKIGEDLYVLHVFKKKSTKGIKTPRGDQEVINSRLKQAKRMASQKGGK